MSLQIDLMGTGIPAGSASLLGISEWTTVAGVGTAQNGAAALNSSNTKGTTTGGATAFLINSNWDLEKSYLFFNSSSTTALVYPPSGGAIDNLATNAAISVPQNQSINIIRKSTTQWTTFGSPALGGMLALANTWTATQTITPAVNTEALIVSGYSLTGSDAHSLFNLAGTWNTTGAPTAVKVNVTSTASDAASLLMDLQIGGTSQFKVSKAGAVTALGTMTVVGGATFLTTSTALTNGSGASTGTLTNGPAVGNPTKWIGINDGGVTRYVPAW